MNAQFLNSAADNEVVAMRASGALDRAAFWRRVNGLTDVIAGHPAQRWALICEDSSWFAAGLFALANSRRVIVVPQAPQAGSLSASGVQVDAVLSDRPEWFSSIELLATSEPEASTSAELRMPEDAVRIEFHTSGSTGTPKCIPKTFAQLRREVESLERQWGGQLGDAVMVGTVPHYHLYGLLFRILWPILCGRPFLASVCLHPASLRAAAAQGRCVIVSSPAFLSRIDKHSDLPQATQVAAVFSSGAPLADATAEKFAAGWGRAIIEVYGSTETGGIAWRAWSGPRERTLWQPIQGVDITLREEPAGSRLWVRSGCTWQAEWMPTGDLARCDDNGRFVLLGRVDDVVKFADKRISLGEMRARLMTHEWVRDARLLLIQGRRTLIGAVVVLDAHGRAALVESGRTAVCGALRSWLRSNYEAVMIPRKWRFIDELPDTDMGKIEYQRLQQLFEQQP
ncbi:MAG TPA: class I adenylate-forming enzyme family protein [Gammaproteobacteria bacterium]|nr:class I adenylate-forming enzyme family protein [Gammaproteobacteria bacterium]